MERRLSAIFAADMVGYSRLMEADEVGTLQRQKAQRAELINPAFEEYHGRIVKEMGDGVLVEFSSVVEAVQCAVFIQQGMADRKADVSDDLRIQFRIGINLGDVIIEGDDIFGDGVNIAARLEQLADPGGICISGTVFDHLKSQIDVEYESMGEVQVKNLKRPIRTYKVLLQNIASEDAFTSLPSIQLADKTKYQFKLPKKASIAIIPFENRSGSADQEYLGDSIADNIIIMLSASPDLVVIARNSAFKLKRKNVSAHEAAEQFGVRYVLTGSFQIVDDRIRVICQLADAIDGTRLWGEKYDHEISDIFDVQDKITEKITEALEIKLSVGQLAKEWRKELKDPENYRLWVQGRAAYTELSQLGNLLAEENWTKLHERSPDTAIANRCLASLHIQKVMFGIGLTGPLEAHLDLARKFTVKAQALEGDEPSSHLNMLLGFFSWIVDGDHELAVRHMDNAVRIAPTSADMLFWAGSSKVYCGQPEDGTRTIRTAMRLEPYYQPMLAVALSEGLIMLNRFDEARAVASEVLANEQQGRHTLHALGHLAVICVFQNKMDEAKVYANRLIALRPNTSILAAKRLKAYDQDRAFVGKFLDALRASGIPEYPLERATK